MKTFLEIPKDVVNIMIVFNFTNLNLLPSGIKFIKPSAKEKIPGKKISEIKEVKGKSILDNLRKRGWRIKDIFFQIKRKTKNGEEYHLYRVKVILDRKPRNDKRNLARLRLLLVTKWEICTIYDNRESPDKNFTFNFAHVLRKPKNSFRPLDAQ